MRRKSWRCFFCDEVFTRRQDAAAHFGADDREASDEPACQIKAHEGHLVHALRKAHDEIKRYLSEDNDVMRSLLELEASSLVDVRRAEEDGYGRGVREVLELACADCKAKVHGRSEPARDESTAPEQPGGWPPS